MGCAACAFFKVWCPCVVCDQADGEVFGCSDVLGDEVVACDEDRVGASGWASSGSCLVKFEARSCLPATNATLDARKALLAAILQASLALQFLVTSLCTSLTFYGVCSLVQTCDGLMYPICDSLLQVRQF
jgi:hypothetical protein